MSRQWSEKQRQKFRMTMARKRSMKKKSRKIRKSKTPSVGTIIERLIEMVVEKKIKDLLIKLSS